MFKKHSQILSLSKKSGTKKESNVWLNSFWKGKVIAEIFSTPWRNSGQRGVTARQGGASPLLTETRLVSRPGPWAAFTHPGSQASTFGIAKQVLIEGSKGIFKFGILGTMEHGLLSLLRFLCPSSGSWASCRTWTRAVLPQECFLRPGSRTPSFLEVGGVVGPGKWPPRGCCFCGRDWQINAHQSFHFPSTLKSQGGRGSLHLTPSAPPPSSPLASVDRSCDACSVYVLTALYPLTVCLVFAVIFRRVHLDVFLEGRVHVF